MKRRLRTMDKIIGVDRYHGNDPVPLKQLIAKGIQFIWFKAAEGNKGADKAFDSSWKEAKATPGLFRGAYFFFDPRFDGIEQCKLFLSLNINFHAEYCIGGCIDVEDLVIFGKDGKEDKSATTAANKWVADNWKLALQRLIDFLNYFKQQTGLDCFIYTYNGYMKEYFHGHAFPNNPMWLSSLQENSPVRYDTGKLPEFHQYTYNWNKSDMDGNYFNGTIDQLKKLGNVV